MKNCKEFSLRIYPGNMVAVIQYKILKIFNMYFSKINQIYLLFYILLVNEKKLVHKILRNTMLSTIVFSEQTLRKHSFHEFLIF